MMDCPYCGTQTISDICPGCGDELDYNADPEYNAEDEYIPCSVCSCLIGDEVSYGDTWDGRSVCAGCAGVEDAGDR